jgi:hypothetical protein
MAKINRYRPTFFEGFEPQTSEFNSIEELLAIDWINSFTEKAYGSTHEFYQFSVSRSAYPKYDNSISLIAEYDKGDYWLVVGNFSGDNDIISQLPVWKAGIK